MTPTPLPSYRKGAHRVRRKRPEQQLQIAVADFLRVALRLPTIWTAFPAGGGGRVRGAFLKAMGLQAGWPDLLVMYHVKTGPLVVGIELKAGKGSQTVEQKAVENRFGYLGAHYCVARSVYEVESFLRIIGIPLHATVRASGVCSSGEGFPSDRGLKSDERHKGAAR